MTTASGSTRSRASSPIQAGRSSFSASFSSFPARYAFFQACSAEQSDQARLKISRERMFTATRANRKCGRQNYSLLEMCGNPTKF